MPFGGRQVKGRAAVVVARLHVLVGVVKPETEVNINTLAGCAT